MSAVIVARVFAPVAVGSWFGNVTVCNHLTISNWIGVFFWLHMGSNVVSGNNINPLSFNNSQMRGSVLWDIYAFVVFCIPSAKWPSGQWMQGEQFVVSLWENWNRWECVKILDLDCIVASSIQKGDRRLTSSMCSGWNLCQWLCSAGTDPESPTVTLILSRLLWRLLRWSPTSRVNCIMWLKSSLSSRSIKNSAACNWAETGPSGKPKNFLIGT